MPAAVWAGFQWRRPKLRKSMRPPREFANRIAFSDCGSRSTAPDHGTVQHLAKCLSGFEAMPFWNRQPPRVHVLRRELRQPDLPEGGGGFAEQPTQFRDRHR